MVRLSETTDSDCIEQNLVLKVLEMHSSGTSVEEISNECRLVQDVVQGILSTNQKLSEEQLQMICMLSKNGRPFSRISSSMHLTEVQVIQALAQAIGVPVIKMKEVLISKEEGCSLEELSIRYSVEIQQLFNIFPLQETYIGHNEEAKEPVQLEKPVESTAAISIFTLPDVRQYTESFEDDKVNEKVIIPTPSAEPIKNIYNMVSQIDSNQSSLPEERRTKCNALRIAIPIVVVISAFLIFWSQNKLAIEEEIEHAPSDDRKCEPVPKNWKLEEEATCTWPDGKSYTGTIKNKKMHGKGILKFLDKSTYLGTFKDDMMNGEGVLTWPTGEKYTGGWRDSKKHGKGTLSLPSGKITEGRWRQDKFIS